MTKNSSAFFGGVFFILGMLVVVATWFLPSDMGINTVVSLAATGLVLFIVGAMLSTISVVMDESEDVIKRLPVEEACNADSDSLPE